MIGGEKAVRFLRARKKLLFVLTNNSTDTVETIHRRLQEFSIPLRKEEILTSARLTAEYLKDRFGTVTYFLVGEPGLESEMDRQGHRRTYGDGARFVVVGLDRRVDYDKLDTAARLVRNGARLIATHTSSLYMYKTGPAMATGPLVKAIEFASGKKATVVGKPSSLMFRIALQKAGCSAADAVMIGDQLDTDILGAARAGIDSVLVETGVAGRAKAKGVVAAIDNVDEIVDLV
jgi:5'-nucleotidase